MRNENRLMQEFLADNGIKAKAKYFFDGSMRGTWRLYNSKVKWYDNLELQNKFTALGFKDFQNDPLDNLSGNGGMFSMCVIAPYKMTERFLNPSPSKQLI